MRAMPIIFVYFALFISCLCLCIHQKKEYDTHARPSSSLSLAIPKTSPTHNAQLLLQVRIPLPKRRLPLPHRHQVGVARHDPVKVPRQRPLVQRAAGPQVGPQAEEGRGDKAVVDALGLSEEPLQGAVDVGVRDLLGFVLFCWGRALVG